MDIGTLSILVFLGIISLLAYLDRKNIEFKYGVIFRRTKRGKKFIKSFVEKHRNLVKWFGNISLIVAFGLSLLGLFFLGSMTYSMFVKPEVAPPVKFILPELPVEGLERYVFVVPFWFWIISIFVIMAPHELSHGVMMAYEKIKIKSLGLILFFIFPGAFVEPDEKTFKKSKPSTKMKIAAVGSVANVVVWLILMGILIGLMNAGGLIFEGSGVMYEGTIENTPANEFNMTGKIIQINENKIGDVLDLRDALDSVQPGDQVRIITVDGEYEFNTVQNPDNSSKSFIGIANVSTEFDYTNNFKFLGNPVMGLTVFNWTMQLFGWIAFLDINVAIANLLPFLPFDGGIIWGALFEKLFKKRAKHMILTLSLVTYFLLAINLIGLQNLANLFGF